MILSHCGNNTKSMNFESFIAGRILTGISENKKISKPIVRIAELSVALGIAVILVSVMIVTGFKKEISSKITGFAAHIRVTNFDSNSSYEEMPISRNQPFVTKLTGDSRINHIQVYAHKAGIIKANDELLGIVLKGVDKNYDWSFFQTRLTEGRIPFIKDSATSTEVLISKSIADKMLLKTGNSFIAFFAEADQHEVRKRKFSISGIYETGLAEDFDNIYVLCDLQQVQKLNNWNPSLIGGFEIMLNDFSQLDQVNNSVYKSIDYNFKTETVKELYPQIFHWLDLQNLNVKIILTLMLIISIINMITTLLILVLDNTQPIGILKSLGTKNITIKKIFLRVLGRILLKGLLIGNLIALVLFFIQRQFSLFTLPQESYYINKVPLNFQIVDFILINTGTVLVCLFFLTLPATIITRINPSRVIRFD